MAIPYSFDFSPSSLPHERDDFFLYDEDPNLALTSLLSLEKPPLTDQMEDLSWDFGHRASSFNPSVDEKAFGADFMKYITGEGLDLFDIHNDIQPQQDQATIDVISPPETIYSVPTSTSTHTHTSTSTSTSTSRSRSRSNSGTPESPVSKPRKSAGRKRNPVINKEAHNKVEKRYRLNINAKFAALNDALPSSPSMNVDYKEEDDDDEVAAKPTLKRSLTTKSKSQFDAEISIPLQNRNKGEILSEAVKHIRQLEQRNDALGREVRILKDNFLPRRRRQVQ